MLRFVNPLFYLYSVNGDCYLIHKGNCLASFNYICTNNSINIAECLFANVFRSSSGTK